MLEVRIFEIADLNTKCTKIFFNTNCCKATKALRLKEILKC